MATTKNDVIRLTTTNQATCTDLINQIEKAYDKINKAFYKGELPDVTITLIPDVRKNSLGWMSAGDTWFKNGKWYTELNICSDHLDRSKVEIYVTLMHEMVHIYCKLKGIADTSSNFTYHNDEFKRVAEAHGLVCEKGKGRHGWSTTYATAKTEKWINEKLPDLIDMKRDIFTKEKKKGSRSISYKYICPHCGNIARTTKEMTLVCGDCLKETGDVYVMGIAK